MNNPPSPPKLPLRFFRWYCHPDYREDIEGDLRERFEKRLDERGIKAAKWGFSRDVVLLFRPGIIRPLKGIQKLNHHVMFKNNFKIAWRNLGKQKMYSSIKIGGFAIGIAACLLITLFIKDELSYDQHIPDKERVYRMILEYNFQGKHGFDATSFPAPFAEALKDEFPEIEKAGRINASKAPLFGAGSNEIRSANSDRNTHEENVVYFDQETLEIMQPTMVEGNLYHALTEPNTIVISKSKADQYFPEGSALGKTLIFNDDEQNPIKVGGVMEDFPDNCHMQYDFLISLTEKEFEPGEQTRWYQNNYHIYIKTQPDTDVAHLEAKLQIIIEKYVAPALESVGLQGAAERLTYHLQPVGNIHLKAAHIQDGMIHGDIRLVQLFGTIAGFIMLLASVNFVNLSTAKSANRAKEVGLRKTLGSLRGNLIQQFLVESILFSLISFVAGVLLSRLVLPHFNELAGKSLVFPWTELWFLAGILPVACFVGLLSGLYPSFYLSAFKPAQVLKGNLSRGTKNASLRSGLVVFQFATSIVLIIGTIVINRQMDFILNEKVGFEKDRLILLQGANTLGDKAESLKNELLKLSEVENVSVSGYLPVEGNDAKRNNNIFSVEGKPNEETYSAQIWRVDEDYIQTMGMKVLKGRDFADAQDNNREKVIINQTMAKKLGLNDPIGQRIDNGQIWEIVGVVEDFHFQSFKENIMALCMVMGNSPSVISVKVNTQHMADVLQSIEAIWNAFSPNQPLRYQFLDERFATMYGNVQRTGKIFSTFALLAIIVACLGLFALSAFMAEQRSKEMSIRKILGASARVIFNLLTFNFLKLVLISLLLAGPVAWYIMQNWLEDFVYKISLAWWFFAVAGLIALAIALITITSQALKVSFSNPVDHLKDD